MTPWDPLGRGSDEVEVRGPRRDQLDIMKQLRSAPVGAGASFNQARGDRPCTPGCSACAAKGTPGHGYHHSMQCRRNFQKWLEQQQRPDPPAPPSAPTAPAAVASSFQPSKHPASGVGEQIARPTKRPREKTPLATLLQDPNKMEVEEESRKRKADTTIQKLEDELREVLRLEAQASDVGEDENWIRMENGVDWMPEVMVHQGDYNEVLGLFADGAYGPISEEKLTEKTRKIGNRLVRRLKGEGVKLRWRLQEFARGKPDKTDDLYAATPQVASLRFLLPLGSHRLVAGEDILGIFGDVTRAFPHAPMDDDIVTQIPEAVDGMTVEANGCKLKVRAGMWVCILKALYGYRRAPRLWQQRLSQRLNQLGLARSQVDPALFFEPEARIWILIHVDDFFMLGRRKETVNLFCKLSMEMKLREIGRLDQVGNQVSFFNKTIQRAQNGYEMINNLWLIDELVKRLGVQDSKHVATPMVQYPQRQVMASAELSRIATSEYRTNIGILMHIAHDRNDIQFATKEVARCMQHPTELDDWRVRRCGRYLRHHRECWQIFELGPERPMELRTPVDSDCGGCVRTRRSTSGGIVTLGNASLLSWARTSGAVTLSSIEAEYRRLVLGAQESILAKNISEGLPVGDCSLVQLDVGVSLGSTTQRSSRQAYGLASALHEGAGRAGVVRVERVPSDSNAADWLTKPVNATVFEKCYSLLSGLRRTAKD